VRNVVVDSPGRLRVRSLTHCSFLLGREVDDAPGRRLHRSGRVRAPSARTAVLLRWRRAYQEPDTPGRGARGAVAPFKATDAVTLAGVDIYHPGEDRLTGHEIGFGGDISRSLKDGAPYLVVET